MDVSNVVEQYEQIMIAITTVGLLVIFLAVFLVGYRMIGDLMLPRSQRLANKRLDGKLKDM